MTTGKIVACILAVHVSALACTIARDLTVVSMQLTMQQQQALHLADEGRTCIGKSAVLSLYILQASFSCITCTHCSVVACRSDIQQQP